MSPELERAPFLRRLLSRISHCIECTGQLPVHQLQQTILHLESNVMSQQQGTYSNTAFPVYAADLNECCSAHVAGIPAAVTLQ